MAGKARFTVLVVLCAFLAAPAATSAEVPDCPRTDGLDGSTVQCATTPGFMSSTMVVAAGSFGGITAMGLPQGTWTVRDEAGAIVMGCTFGPAPSSCFVWAFVGGEGDWTSTIELTNGVGVVLVEWEMG